MSVCYCEETKTFYLDGKNITYAFCINAHGYAEHLYFGAKIPHEPLFFTREWGAEGCTVTPPGKDFFKAPLVSYNQMNTEINFYGTGDFREPCLLVQNGNGDRLTELLFDSYEIVPQKPPIPGMPSLDGGETLILHLKDTVTGFCADLFYTAFDDADVIARHIVYRNGGRQTAVMQRAYSFSLSLPERDYRVLTLYGAWARERTEEIIPMHHGVVSVDSKRTTSSSFLNPFMGILSQEATEDAGEVWGINLVYSSSFVLKAEGTQVGETLLTGGINDFDFSWKLEPGESLAVPEVVLAYSDKGVGGMSRALHDAYREHLINKRYVKAVRPLVINNWEGTYFNFNNEKLMAIVDAVADTGIDTFVLDDGWFGNRENDRSGLGDWFVNTTKLEGGLKTVIDHVHQKGMKFGLWFEPEMISEDSDIYRAHPEYAIRVPDREPCHGRHQLMMDLTRAEVRDYIVNVVNTMLKENEIDYVKWDYNRNVTESFTPGREKDRQQEFAHRYVLGVYDLCERIVEANPHVFFEGCSAGGARFDPAMLRYFSQIWCSDDSDARERTLIQYGTTYAYPLSAMSCHVSICPNHQTQRSTPFATRGDIAHLGATGYELDTTLLTPEDIQSIRVQVEEYRWMQELITEGDLYRVENPFRGNYFACAVVSKKKHKGILTLFRCLSKPDDETKRFRMKGLDPQKKYFVRELEQTLSGSVLLNIGLPGQFGSGDFKTCTYHFEEK